MSRPANAPRTPFASVDPESVELRLSELADTSARTFLQGLFLTIILTGMSINRMPAAVLGGGFAIVFVLMLVRVLTLSRLASAIDDGDLRRMQRIEKVFAVLTWTLGSYNAFLIAATPSANPQYDAVLCAIGLLAPLGGIRTLGLSPPAFLGMLVPLIAASTIVMTRAFGGPDKWMLWIGYAVTVSLIVESCWRFMVANRSALDAEAQTRRLADRQWNLFDSSPLAIALTREGRLARANAKLQAWFVPEAAASATQPLVAQPTPPREPAPDSRESMRRGWRNGKRGDKGGGRQRLQAMLGDSPSAGETAVTFEQVLLGVAARTGRSRERLQRLVQRAETRVHGHRSVELRVPLRNGLPSYVGIQIRRFDPMRPAEGMVWSMSDRTAEWQNRQALERAALHDPLTGALNRRGLIGKLEALLERKLDERPLAVLCLDMNGFKPLNDRHGHAFGDHVLRAITERLKHTLRASDLVARPGGDEFIIVLDPVQSRSEAVAVAERISEVICNPLVIEGLACRVQAAIGMASAPEDGTTVDALIAVADREMYAVKRAISPGLLPPAERTSQDRRFPR